MKQRVSLRCRCGKLRGVAEEVSPDDGNHAFCYCDDCQAYAHYLGRADALDRWGGTDIFQMCPTQVKLTDGAEHLRCMRLGPKGLFRFYAGCCNTAVGNMAGQRIPFVGIVHTFIDAPDATSRDALLGPPLAHVQAKFAQGDVPPHFDQRWPLSLLARSVRLLTRWWLRGGTRASAFFDERGQPRVEAKVISKEERVALRQQVGAAA